MSGSKADFPFFPIETSTVPSFNSTALSTAFTYALQSTTTREWAGPSNRSVRVVSLNSTEPFYIQFGNSTVVASTANGFLIPGSWPSIFHVTAAQTHISITSPVAIVANITLGYGG